MVSGFKKKLKKVISELPDWDALWLNGTETEKGIDYSESLNRVRKIWGTFGYIVNSSFYDVLIEGFEKERKSADYYLTSIQKKYNVFSVKKPLVKHRKGISDIAGIVVERYKHLE